MDSWYIYYMLLLVLFISWYLPWKRRKRYAAKKVIINSKMKKEKRSDTKIMRELAERFIGKDVYINLLDGKADGVIKDVTDSGIVLENKDGIQIVNLDYVIKLREYPYKKGKRATIWE